MNMSGNLGADGTRLGISHPLHDTMLTTVTLGGSIEAIAYDGAQHAPAGGERKTSEAHRESARLDGERCQRAAGGRGLKAVGICLPGFSRFAGWQASLYPRQHPGDMGGHVASSKLQRKCQRRGQASEMA